MWRHFVKKSCNNGVFDKMMYIEQATWRHFVQKSCNSCSIVSGDVSQCSHRPTSCHEFKSQFGLPIFWYAKNTQKLSRRPSLAQVSVECAGHGRSPATTRSATTAIIAGERLNQNDEKQQVKRRQREFMGICQKKCHFGFSKSSKFNGVVVLLVLMTFFSLCTIVVNIAIRSHA